MDADLEKIREWLAGRADDASADAIREQLSKPDSPVRSLFEWLSDPGTQEESPSPGALLAAAKNGDDNAKDELFLLCYTKALRSVNRQLKPQYERHFGSSEIASKAWQSFKFFIEENDVHNINLLNNFMRKVVVGLVQNDLHWIQASQRYVKRMVSDHRDLVELPGEPAQMDVVNSHPVESLEILTARERHAFILAKEGKIASEIAAETGLTIRVIIKLLKSAYDKLKRKE